MLCTSTPSKKCYQTIFLGRHGSLLSAALSYLPLRSTKHWAAQARRTIHPPNTQPGSPTPSEEVKLLMSCTKLEPQLVTSKTLSQQQLASPPGLRSTLSLF